MTTKNLLVFSVLIALSMASWYLSELYNAIEDQTEEITLPTNQFYMLSTKILGTDSNGESLYKIEANHAQQLENDKIKFENVYITYSIESDVPWTINANSAIASANHEAFSLSGNVLAKSTNKLSGEITEISTQYLELQPRKYTVKTTSPVKIKIGEKILAATGLLALLDENQLMLESSVNGEFLPQ